MPNPNDYKDKQSFLDACIPMVIEEGTAKDGAQASAICHSMWDKKKDISEMNARIKTGKLTRTFEIDTRELDKEKRTIPLSFSSNAKIERFFGIEVLDHGPQSIRMDRLKKGLPVLVNHDPNKQIGILENPRIDSDRKGRGLARFGQSQLASEIWQDIQDGIRKEVSVGYQIHHMIQEESKEDIKVFRATDWEPLEVSIVSIPADISVGIGRGEGSEYEISVDKKEINKMAEDKVTTAVDIAEIQKQAREKENTRVSEIMAMGQKIGKLDDSLKYVHEGKTVDEFRNFILDSALANLKPTVEVGVNRATQEPFKNFGEFLYTRRFHQEDPRLVRLLQMGVGSSGGYMVPVEFIDRLLSVSPAEAVFRPRATVIPGGSSPDATVELPVLDQTSAQNRYGGVSFTWIAEGQTKPETDMKLRMVSLTPKECAGHIVVTDKLLENWASCSSVVETQFRGAKIFAEETAFISGSGVGRPLGILNVGTTGSIVISRTTASSIVWADIYTMFARAKFGGSLVWVGNQTILPQLIPMVDAASNLVWQPNGREGIPGTLMGIPLIFNERFPALGSKGDLCLVDLSYYLIKDGSGPYLDASPHVYFTQNRTVIKFYWRVDGMLWLSEPIPIEGATSNTVSPIVVLQ